MAYVLLSQSFGAAKANLPVTITEVSTGIPAIILSSATGGLVNSNGDTVLDASGNLSCYVDGAKTWQVNVDSGATAGPAGLLTSGQVAAGAVAVAGLKADGSLVNSAGTVVGLTPTQVTQTQALVSGAIAQSFGMRNVCIAGDSIAQQNTNVVSSTYNYMARGPVSWMLSYLGWPWEMQPSDNFAVFGTTLDIIIRDQLPLILAANTTRKYQRCFLSCGANDTNAGTSIATIKGYFTTLFTALNNAGITPVHTGIRPRGNDGSLTTAKQANQQLNDWLYVLGSTGFIEFVDVTEVYANNATAFGNVLTTLVYDSGSTILHPNNRGANLEGKFMADWYIARGVKPGLRFATQQSDAFDRTNNPRGVAFSSANPLMQGGTTTPTGMTTTGGTWSKVSRTLSNGQTRSDPQCALAASTLHHLYDDWVGSGAWTASQLQPGDIIEGRAVIDIASGVNINSIQLRLDENDGSGGISHYCLFTADNGIADDTRTIYLKTPRVPIRAYAGSGNVSIFQRVECTTAAAGSGTMTVRGFEVRVVG